MSAAAAATVGADGAHATSFVRAWRNKMGDIALATSSGAAILIVLVILTVILGDAVIHGIGRLSPRFFFTAPG